MISNHSFSNKNRSAKRKLAAFLAVAFIYSSTLPVLASAQAGSTPKQEVVYIILADNGSVDNIYVVNIFELSGDGKIIDYGDYTALRNMTTNDEIIFDDETVTIDTKAGKLYYEGQLNANVIPWSFSIRYFIDGTEYSADDLAGKSGALKITMSVRENAACSSPFFDNYALQAAFSLDTEQCKNIISENATAANIGRKKQLAYTILPGKETNITITADVTDFEMDGVAINGVPLSMNLDVNLENDEDLNELTNGIDKLDDGAIELKDGSFKLSDGAGELVGGIRNLQGGGNKLYEGAVSLNTGINELNNGVAQLHEGVITLQTGSSNLVQGAKGLRDGASDLNDGINRLWQGSNTLNKGLSDAQSASSGLSNGASELKSGVNDARDGACNLSAGLSALTSQNETLLGGAYSVFQQLTEQAEKQLNQSLTEVGYPAVTLTPENYNDVLNGLLAAIGSMAPPQEPPSSPEVPSQVPTDPSSDDSGEVSDGNDPEETSHEKPVELPDMDKPSEPEISEDKPAEGTATAAGPSASTISADEVQYAVRALQKQLNDYDNFYTGLQGYTNGVGSAASGSRDLAGGADKLLAGAAALQAGADELSKGLSTLSQGSAELVAGVKALQDGSAKLLEGILVLEDGSVQLHNGVIALADGTSALMEGSNKLSDGTVELLDGTIELKDGVIELLNGAIALQDGLITLQDGTIQLSDGTFELRDKTADLDESIKDKITSTLDDMLGAGFEPVSFVSDKNTDVEFVQFVIKTDGVHQTDTAVSAEMPSQPLTIWQKFLKLFGWES